MKTKGMKTGQYFSLITGILLLSLGILGFIPGIQHPVNFVETHDGIDIQVSYLFGLIPTNPTFNLLRMSLGVLGLVGSIGLGGARIFARGVFFAYLIFAALGLIPSFDTFFGLLPLYGSNVAFHAVFAALGFYFGFIESPGLLEIAAVPPEGAVPIEKY